MSGPWQFRPARTDDLQGLYAVWRASVAATHAFLTPADLETISAQVLDDYLPKAELLVATDAEDRPIGFMGQTGVEIDSLFLHPAWRGRGLGRAFVDRAQSAAGGAALEVSVNEQNPLAVGFYEALGFVAYARTATDGDGRPFPLFKMRRPGP